MAWLSQVFQRYVPYDILDWFPRQWLDSHFRLDCIELP